MSTNDEIRKAVTEVFEDYAFGPMTRVQAVDALLSALAPYLAPHPAQQGEDGIAELERKLRQSQQKYSDGFECVPFCELSGEVERFLAARSHSKQEGGA